MSKDLITTNQTETFIIPTKEDRVPLEELDGFTIDFERIKIPSGRYNSIRSTFR